MAGAAVEGPGWEVAVMAGNRPRTAREGARGTGERLRLEEELTSARAMLEQRERLCLLLEGLVESLADGLAALDFRGKLVHISESLRRAGDAVGIPGDDTRASLPAPVLRRLRREARQISPGRTRGFDLDWERPETGVRSYHVVGTTGTGSGPMARGALTLFAFHDRTREAALEEELARARNLAALGQMAGTVAHELRNPLGGIQGFANLLERDLAGQPGPLRLVQRILQGVEGANRIVGDLLEYCRPLEPKPEAISLRVLLGESLAALKESSRWKEGCALDLSVDPDIPPCLVDRRLLLQVLANLYHNALDAMGAGGTLSVRARASDPGTQPGRLRVVVRDTGCGLTAEEAAQIFAPFYTTKPGGTGLGLALVRRIVEAHGGRVHVISAPARGASIVLDLPAADVDVREDERTFALREAA